MLHGIFVTRYVWDEEGEGRVVGWDGVGWERREGRGSEEGVVR